MKRFHCSELEKWQTPAKLKSAVQSGPGQLSIVQAFNVKPKKCDKDHPRQKLISQSIVTNLVIGCGLPHLVVENPKFRKFMKDIDALWDPISARWISDVKLPELASRLKSKITHMVDAVKHLSGTLDIWSDRRMRGITGVGAVWIAAVGALYSN